MRHWSRRGLLHLPLSLLLLTSVVGAGAQHAQGNIAVAGQSIPEVGPAAPSDLPDGLQALEPSDLEAAPSGALDAETPPAANSVSPSGGPGRLAPLQYAVQPGDSLATIAALFGIDVPSLSGSNDLADPDLVPIGTELTVPPVPGLIYRVVEGDTLNSIAERYRLAARNILQANDLQDSELITPGERLILPGARPPAPVAQRLEPRAVVEMATAPARPSFLWPVGGVITTYFGEIGWTSPRGHAGLDIAAPWGTPISAAESGRVLVATRAGGAYGIQVIIDHGNGLRTVYGHLSQLQVDPDERVGRGQLIGLVGSTGFSTGPHLHFEVRQDGELRDPISFLP